MHKGTLLVAGAVLAGATAAFTSQDTQDAAFSPSPETLALMAPGPMHSLLQPLVGEWSLRGKWRMTPDADWEEFTADVEREWIMDGRFVREIVESEWMDRPFQGMGILGYDNLREELSFVWVENMATTTWTSTGSIDESGKVLTLVGENSNAMTGEKNAWSKSVIEITSADEHSYTGYMKTRDGEVFENMTMVLQRK